MNQDTSSFSLMPIKERYLLATCLPTYLDGNGRRYTDVLWVKDLLEHVKYLNCLIIAAPCKKRTPPDNTVPLDNYPELSRISYVDLPGSKNIITAILMLPYTFYLLWKAVGNADIVHGSIVGLPLPFGWLLTPMVKIRRKFFLVVVESATWRASKNIDNSLRSVARIIIGFIFENVNRWVVNNTDIAFFTQEQYLNSLLTRNPKNGHVINASWIDEEVVLSDIEIKLLQERKLTSTDMGLNVLFVGRLTANKGISVLLDAMQSQKLRGTAIKLDILGDGDCLNACIENSKSCPMPNRIRVLGVLPYGRQFFNALREYDVVIVPTLSDEQPRIVYDAYSRSC